MRSIDLLKTLAAIYSKKKKALFYPMTAMAFFLMQGIQVQADPVITVRFSNPEYVYETQIYTLDIEFQSNTDSIGLFGMNVRFFYPDNILEFISFGEFAEGYGPMIPNPPIISTGNESSGMILFGFPGPQEYLNGAIQKTGTTSIVLSTTGWTKIFNASFHVDDTNSIDIDNFCPPVIWDLNEDQSCGIAAGIIITVIEGSGSAPAIENCLQFNWQYDGIPGYPHGYPVETDCISTSMAYTVPTNNILQNITILPDEFACYDATDTITVAGEGTTFIVNAGGDVSLIAGQNILLLSGTLVISGGHMLAAITTTENFCSSYENSIISNPPPANEEIMLDQAIDGKRLKIYPNPTHSSFTLILDEPVDSQAYYLQVSGMMGNTIIQQKLEESEQYEFDLTGQNPGIYIVRILRGDQVDTYKLVKQ
jgi:hypothetical protein